MIFLRPEPSNSPIRYIESIEKAGLIVLPNESIAMYTSRVSPNKGPQGDPGTDQNSLFDTIIASCSDELTPIIISGGLAKTHFRAPYQLDLSSGYIRMSLRDSPIGSDFIVDVFMNGNTVFSTLLRIDIGELSSVTSAIPAVLSVTNIPDDALFEVFVTQIGSSFAGNGLKVSVTGIKVEA